MLKTSRDLVEKGRDIIIMKKLLSIGVALSVIILGACNGESKVEKVKAEVFVEQEDTNLLVQEHINLLVPQQKELEKNIANETGLEEESVKVNLIPISDENNAEIACTVFLSTENELNKTTVQDIVKNIMTAVSDIENTELREKNIIITNLKGEILN